MQQREYDDIQNELKQAQFSILAERVVKLTNQRDAALTLLSDFINNPAIAARLRSASTDCHLGDPTLYNEQLWKLHGKINLFLEQMKTDSSYAEKNKDEHGNHYLDVRTNNHDN